MDNAPLHYLPAHELSRQLTQGEVTSVALTEALLARIETQNPVINAVVTQNREQALAAARASDQRRQQGAPLGPLDGLPLTIKDTWEVPGFACTAGAPVLQHHRPTLAANAIARLLEGGAVILGKTNVPLYASDLQSYNRLFGTTNNPYGISHTAGGSSGGAAAALAAGMTPLEVGSDLAGSIRTPAHFCGVFGHKASRHLISMRGHIPGPPGTQSEPDLAVAGPMARSARDLELLLTGLAGPRPDQARSWQLNMEPASLTSLSQCRIGLWFDDPHCPISQELSGGYNTLADRLKGLACHIGTADHPLLSLDKLLPLYFNLLGSLLSPSLKPAQRRQMLWISRLEKILRHLGPMTTGIGQYGRGVNQPVHQWLIHHEHREQMRSQIESLFQGVDVLLTPITPTAAIPHDQSDPVVRRQITVNGQQRSYMDQFCWIALASLLGLPATSVPIGRTAAGLPFGVQVIAAPGQDLTTIRFAELLEAEGLAGFTPPQAQDNVGGTQRYNRERLDEAAD
ncbi:amidase [Marinobacter sp. CA1]|uniref:amidase n=1 Tax=Marinobacter sp. CA1 TaxID=2817656 RepID=UPI001D05FE4C|nr:amidase [Marinobacter sp. CA1]